MTEEPSLKELRSGGSFNNTSVEIHLCGRQQVEEARL